MREGGLQGIEAIVEGQQCMRKATMTASSSSERTVDLGCLGPVGRSPTEVRRFHLATVFWLMPYRAARVVSPMVV